MRRTLTAVTLALAGVSSAGFSADREQFLVLLQGDQRQRIIEATTAAGATITHDLPIISAIGARMDAQQLDRLRALPFVERVIDDLAYRPVPEPTADGACPLASGLQLSWDGASARWQIYNKGREPLRVDAVSLGWDTRLGALEALQVDGEDSELPAAASQLEKLPLEWSIPANGTGELALTFSAPPASAVDGQNGLTLELFAGSNCSTSLVPSYPWPLADTYYPTVSGAALLQQHGVTGAGVTVAVLDSGLWEEPSGLRLDTKGKPRVVARYDAVQGREVDAARDESGHGTHMTSIIADSRPSGSSSAPQGYRGVAPDASLVVVKAFDAGGEAGFLDLVRAVQWVTDNRERLDIRVLNLSFASRPRWPYYDDPVNQALMRAWEAGITVIAAAGNEGPDPMTVGSPGNLPYLITVGAVTDSWTVDDRDDDYLPDFSSRGPTPSGHIKPDIVAYGGHMAGIMRPGATLAQQYPEYFLSDGSFVMTGSSQAAALVSGLAALLLQAEPDVSNDDIKCMLMSSAEPAISPDGRFAYSPFLQGSGLVNVGRAITLGERGCGNAGLDLAADIARSDHFRGPAVFPDDGSAPSLPGQDSLINPAQPEKGASESRRWGAEAHLRRLLDPAQPSPIDWLGRVRADVEKMRALAEPSR